MLRQIVPKQNFIGGIVKVSPGRQVGRDWVSTTLLLALTLLVVFSYPSGVAAEQVIEFDVPGTGSFPIPANVTSIKVEVWGGGGGGGSVSRGWFDDPVSSGGGGGGAYASRIFQVSSGATFSYRVGSGGASASEGGNSWFGSTSSLLARGGAGVSHNDRTGGAGGSAAASVGDVVFGGGRGANTSGSASGGGGGSAGSSSAGNNGSGTAGGSAVTGGGAGGVGSSGGDGNPGSQPGGGGGGAVCRFWVCLWANGGAGAPGRVRITYAMLEEPGTCFDERFDSDLADDWITSVSRNSIPPDVADGRLRMTENIGNQATAASYQRLFPGADNLIQVEFDYYAYGGSGADGIAVVFSDASVSPQAGGYGGSLGYAQEPDGSGGFAGGWLGVGLDEFGNFSNDSEGRDGGNNGPTPDSVAVRGASPDYEYIADSGELFPGIDSYNDNSPYRYRITIDSRGGKTPVLTVERNGRGTGNRFETLIQVTLNDQPPVPENLFFSLTGSTGGSTNIHELDNLDICADKVGEIENRVHHFEIEHSGSGLTCRPEEVAIRACDNADCSVVFADPVEVTMSPSGWLGGDTFTIDGGVGTRSLAITSPGTITLGVPGSDPGTVAFSRTLCDDGPGDPGADQCDMTFFDSGFDITVPDHVSDVEVSASIAAVRRDDTSEQCVPGFENEKRAVALWSTYVNPSSGTRSVFREDSPMPSSAGGTTPLEFDGNGVATIGVRYPDVGRIRLNARYEGSGDDAGLEMEGNGTFVARPDHFQLAIPGNPAAASVHDDNAFVAAGGDFEIRVSSINASGDVTPNFGKETPVEAVSLESILVAPMGGDDPPMSGAFAAFGEDCDGAPAAGGTACGLFQWPEVGIIKVNPTLTSGSYLSSGDVDGRAISHVGRFIPDRFQITTGAIDPGALKAGCTVDAAADIHYVGQPMQWGRPPSVPIVALSRQGTVTKNYTRGDFMRLLDTGVQRQFPATDKTQITSNGSAKLTVESTQRTGDIQIDNTNGPGVMDYVFSGQDVFWYPKTRDALVAPFSPDLELALTSVSDRDGVRAPVSSLPYEFTAGLALDADTGNSFAVRYGRLAMENVYGPEDLDELIMPVRLESWNGTGWQPHEAGSCLPSNLTAVQDAAGTTTDHHSLDLAAGLQLGATVGEYWLRLVPNGTQGTDSLEWSLSSGVGAGQPPAGNDWLMHFWERDPNPNVLQNPSALATFGVYRGHDRIIYWREVR